jgi:hypothetical protein
MESQLKVKLEKQLLRWHFAISQLLIIAINCSAFSREPPLPDVQTMQEAAGWRY